MKLPNSTSLNRKIYSLGDLSPFCLRSCFTLNDCWYIHLESARITVTRNDPVCHCICYCLVLLLLLYYFCSLIVFLFYNKFFFSMDLAVCSQSGWSTAWDPCILPSQILINTVVFATHSSIFNFLLYVLKLKMFKLKGAFESQLWDPPSLENFISQDCFEFICPVCVHAFVCVCVHLSSEIKIEYGNN